MVIEVGLDIGHDPTTFPPSKGVYHNGKAYAEHTYNAKTTLVIERHLKRHGIRVYMAQQPFGPPVGLTRRLQLYNARKVDLLWSTHANAGNASAEGIGIFYWSTTKTGADRLAKYYIEEIRAKGLKLWGSGVHKSVLNTWSDFAICRDFAGPSVLAENGFMTNKNDVKLIFETPAYIEQTGEASAKAICRFVGVKWIPEGGAVAVTKPTPKPARKPAEKEVDILNNEMIVINSMDDFPAASRLASRLGCAIAQRNVASKHKLAKKIYVCGGSKEGLKGDAFVVLAGKDFFETAEKIENHMN